MKRIALWIVGAPCAGKTTLARALLGEGPYTLIERPKWTCAGRVAAAGHYTGATFDGADRISYSGGREALRYWAEKFAPVVRLTIFDGDRLSHAGAVEAVRPHVDRVACVFVRSPCPAVLEARRADRGWHPDSIWLKGRETKAARFFGTFTDALTASDDLLARVLAFIEQRPYIEPRVDP